MRMWEGRRTLVVFYRVKPVVKPEVRPTRLPHRQPGLVVPKGTAGPGVEGEGEHAHNQNDKDTNNPT